VHISPLSRRLEPRDFFMTYDRGHLLTESLSFRCDTSGYQSRAERVESSVGAEEVAADVSPEADSSEEATQKTANDTVTADIIPDEQDQKDGLQADTIEGSSSSLNEAADE
jgi:hypothetical protein